MQDKRNFTSGPILGPLLLFSLPILLALFLQALYGAVDLLVVGKYAEAADVSAVAVGSQIMMTITSLISSFAMGMTILLGQKIGEGDRKALGGIIGSGTTAFFVVGIVCTGLIPLLSGMLARWMHSPQEAFDETRQYMPSVASAR